MRNSDATSGHQARYVTQYGVEVFNGWPTKLYGLAVEGEPGQELLDAARVLAAATLPTTSDPRAAFVIAHRARPACFVLIYWWASPVDLSLAYFRSPLDQPDDLTPMPAHSTGCVWELALTDHERQAWVRHLLDADTPDLAAYLAAGPPQEVK
ncbi:hypothetical protein [Streptomyces sp. SID13031]|uniref:hypothetical protein n=1 Tax=Streptomyces sp. SID13031 TaxID=2706046 RepID=UPI0013CC76AF|nr:hypothetical protein [Streptomyces sp. SID13031]NEA36778.1 hypothetical protein [Streptomyces sp. SID13031]